MDEQKLIEAFQLMWGKYPEQVRLIRKDHTIVAGNESYMRFGGPVGTKCNVGDPSMHAGCRAIESLKAGETKTVAHEIEGEKYESFWVPVAGTADYYVHFTNGMNALLAKMAAQQPPRES